jgi:ribosomal-protein-alanine N-acetyltransferase
MTSPGPLGDARTVRPLTPADVPRLVALERMLFGVSAWSEVMLREELDGPGRWYVGVDGDDLVRGDTSIVPLSRCVAYAGLWFDGDVAQVMTIGVVPSAQRRGIGRMLLGALVDHARHLGASAVLLEVRVDNEPAIALYGSMGFTTLSRRRRYYQPENVDAWTMRLPM